MKVSSLCQIYKNNEDTLLDEMISDTLFHTESQIDDIEIPGIFDILECGEDDSTVKFLLGFNDDSTRCFATDGGDPDDHIKSFTRGLKDDDCSTDSEDLQNMVPFDKCITCSVVLPPGTGQRKAKSKKRLNQKSNGPKRRNQTRNYDFPCTHCFKRFSTPFNLRRHMNLNCTPELKLAGLVNKNVQKKDKKRPEKVKKSEKKTAPKIADEDLTPREALYRKIRRQRKKMWRQKVKNQKQMKQYNQQILPKLMSLEPVPVHELENLEPIQPQSQLFNMSNRKSVVENNMILLENFLHPQCQVTYLEDENGLLNEFVNVMDGSSNDQTFDAGRFQEDHDLNKIELYHPHLTQDNATDKGVEFFTENNLQENFDDSSVLMECNSMEVSKDENYFYIDGKPFVIVRPVGDVDKEWQFHHSTSGLNLTYDSGSPDDASGQGINPLDGLENNGDLVEIVLTSGGNKSEKSSLVKDQTLPENLQLTLEDQVNLSYSFNHLVDEGRVTLIEADGEVSMNDETSVQTEGPLHQKDLPHQIYLFGDLEDPQYELSSNLYPTMVQGFQENLHPEPSLGTNNLYSTGVHLPLPMQRSELQTSGMPLVQDQQECQPHPGSDNVGSIKLVTNAPTVLSKSTALTLKDPSKNCLPDVTQVPRGWMRRVTMESGNRKVYYFSTVGKKFTDSKEIANHFARLGQTVKQGVFNFN